MWLIHGPGVDAHALKFKKHRCHIAQWFFPLVSITVCSVPCCHSPEYLIFMFSPGHGLKHLHFQVLAIWQNTLVNFCPMKIISLSVSPNSPTISSCSIFTLAWTLTSALTTMQCCRSKIPQLTRSSAVYQFSARCHLWLLTILLKITWNYASTMFATFSLHS